jgi:hypothetical protein
MKSTLVWLAVFAVGFTPVLGSAQEKPVAPVYQSNPPAYALHLIDGRTAIVWWDARNGASAPQWKCDVPPRRDGSDDRVIPLRAKGGEWRAALDEATTLLRGEIADGE